MEKFNLKLSSTASSERSIWMGPTLEGEGRSLDALPLATNLQLWTRMFEVENIKKGSPLRKGGLQHNHDDDRVYPTSFSTWREEGKKGKWREAGCSVDFDEIVAWNSI